MVCPWIVPSSKNSQLILSCPIPSLFIVEGRKEYLNRVAYFELMYFRTDYENYVKNRIV